ncbi:MULTISPECIES: MauE/DoxX family redox-associated membrane protein [unclassified Nonomuraea]|uniref:MauE/DoxX family redox-associated membrane protein n=1 Tax=unclassified Nonomuraea TaxID=2593643 RepID=UPI0033E6B8B6
MPYIELGCRAVLCLVFLAALAGKATGWRAFVSSVPGLAPRLPAVPVAVAVLAGESAAVVLLVLGERAGFMLAAVLLAAFAAAILLALRRGAAATCRCFGVTAAPLSRVQIVRNLLLIAVAVTGWVMPGGRVELAGVALALVAAAVLAAVLVLFDDLADLLLERNL